MIYIAKILSIDAIFYNRNIVKNHIQLNLGIMMTSQQFLDGQSNVRMII
jgi:hypothetical protein